MCVACYRVLQEYSLYCWWLVAGVHDRRRNRVWSRSTRGKPSSGATLPTTNPTGHAVWYMLQRKWQWDRPFSPYCNFPASVSFHQCFTPVFHPFITHDMIPARVLWHPVVPRNVYIGSTRNCAVNKHKFWKAAEILNMWALCEAGTEVMYCVWKPIPCGCGCWLTAGFRPHCRYSPCEICVGSSGTVTGFCPRTSVFPCQYRSTNAP